MFPEKTRQEFADDVKPAGWAGFYRLAGTGVLVSTGLTVLDIALSFMGGDVATGSMSAADWFVHFQTNWFVGLRNLGLFNVINTILTIPLYLVLYRMHRRSAPAFAALALILFILGAAIYGANNRALAMLELSQQYAAAGGGAEKALLETAGTLLLAQAEDFTPGSFTGFLVSSLASLLMVTVMLRGPFFRRWIGLTGLIGMAFLLFFTISVTFVPATFEVAMLFALVGGLCMLAWNIAMAAAMFGMGWGNNILRVATQSTTNHPS